MNRIKDIAMDLFMIKSDAKKCKCNAAHEVCLNCDYCRVNEEKQLATDFKNINQYIDHTLLKPDTLAKDVRNLCKDAIKYNFKSVCVLPAFVYIAKKVRKHPTICTVVGFPLGAHEMNNKYHEAAYALKAGAKELDMVINVGFLKDDLLEEVTDEIYVLSMICKENKALLKVIIETCLLTDDEIIIVSLLAKRYGADFIKTSTGFSTGGATVEAVKLIRNTVGDYMGVKASGGIKTKKDAIAMLKAGANRIGSSNSIAIVSE